MLLMANPAGEVDRACRACRCQAAQAPSCKIRSTVSGQRRGDKYGQSWLSSFRLTVTPPRIPADLVDGAVEVLEVRLRDGEGEGDDGVIGHGFLLRFGTVEPFPGPARRTTHGATKARSETRFPKPDPWASCPTSRPRFSMVREASRWPASTPSQPISLARAITAERAALSSTQVNTVTFPDSLVHFIR